jgi:hypothetical protein
MRYAGYRFRAEIIGNAMPCGYISRFPLGLRMVEELLAARGIIVNHETVRQWARKFGQQFANQIRRRLPGLATNGTWMRSCSKCRSKALALVSRRPSRRRARRPGPTPTQQANGQAAAAQTAEEADAAASWS